MDERRETISSTQNSGVKHVVALQQKSSLRRREGVFVVEGRREITHCLEAGYEIANLYLCPPLYEHAELTDKQGHEADCRVDEILSKMNDNVQISEVTPTVYEKMAYRGGTEGMIAVVKSRPLDLEHLCLKENPLIIVLESVEKPGNLGAILRSADAAGVDAVIVCDPLTDLYNPNLIRSSIGAIFSVPCVACNTKDCITFLKDRNIHILTAQLQDSRLYYDTDMCRGTAIVMGTESTGLSSAWRAAADAHIRIPMRGRLDSLNVSVSAAILLYEAVRQRSHMGN